MKAENNKINSHNEWDKLREIIVGTAEGTMPTLTWNKPGEIPRDILEKAYSLAYDAAPKWFYEEVSEDLQGLSDALEGLGIKVHRPEVFDFSKMFSNMLLSSTSILPVEEPINILIAPTFLGSVFRTSSKLSLEAPIKKE